MIKQVYVKQFGFIFMLLFLSIFCYAEPAKLGQEYTVWSNIQQGAQPYNSTAAQVTIYFPNSSLLGTYNMSEVSTGLYNFTFTPTVIGDYYLSTIFYDGLSVVGLASETIVVEQSVSIGSTPINMAGETLALILGIAIVIGFLLYFAFKVEESHPVLHFLILIIVLATLLLIPKAMVDNKDHCAIAPVNSTIDGNVNYDYVCSPNTKQTENIFYNIIVWFIRIIAFYTLIYVLYLGFKWLEEKYKW